MSKTRKIVGWALTVLISALLLFSVSGKFFNPEMRSGMTSWGLEEYITIIALGELLATLLFIIPRTNILGSLLLCSHMGGAIVIHMSHSESFSLQASVLIMVWIIAFVRNPKLSEILKGN